jgi:tRNA pseudouridine(38-40) synthase
MIPTHPCDTVNVTNNGKLSCYKEMDYCTMLNRCLPNEIRVLGWSPVTEEFSARFSASHRLYRYFFIKGSLDIAAMTQAANLLVGKHDFRNFCKLDIANVTNFEREVYAANIICFKTDSSHYEDSVYMLEIKGIAFLWHMVRCIMAILFLVGEKKESPHIVQELLAIDKVPAKPSYQMADDFPLVLHECGFENLSIALSPKNLWYLTEHFIRIKSNHLIAAAQAENALNYLNQGKVRYNDVQEFKDEMHALVLKKSGDDEIKQSSSKDNRPEKRKYSQIDDSQSAGENCDLQTIPWMEAMVEIQKELPFESIGTYTPHIPLLSVSLIVLYLSS